MVLTRKILFSTLLLAFLALGFSPSAKAQTKIGYTTVELLLNYLPETKAINKQLETYENKLSEKLGIKQRYYQSELQTYMEKEQTNRWASASEKEEMATKLGKLEKEIQTELQTAELDMMRKRNELLGPVQEKMQKAIDDVAKEGGYTYILNNTVGSGVPTVLYGSESIDVTDKIAAKLGITLPKGDE